MGVFGEKLRKQREQRGIALEAISNSTKISTRMLRALEEEKFEQLPGGVFNKGFVRAYARHVGLNEEEAVSDYLEALRETQIQSQQILPNFRGSKADAAQTHPANPPSLRTPERTPEAPSAHETIFASSSSTQGSAEHSASASTASRIEPFSQQEASPVADDRRKLERRSDERRHVERRNHDDQASQRQSSEGEQNQDSRDQERIAEDVAPWQIEDRRAADLLSQVRQGKADTLRHLGASPLFSSGSFGEPESGLSNGGWRKIGAGLLVILMLLGFWRLHHRNLTRFSAQAAGAPIAFSEHRTAVSEPRQLQIPVAKTSLETDASSGSVKFSERPPSGMAKSADADSSSAIHSASRKIAPKTAASFTLLIRAEKTSWISVMADGQPVAQETLIAPAETSIRASNEIIVKAGNAAGVSFILNAKEIPAQGKEGEVRTYTFDGSGMKLADSQTSN